MIETRFFSRQMVLADRCIAGELIVRDGMIEGIEESASPSVEAQDLGDDLLIPGLVDIHTDNLEKHYQPRPGASWDDIGAVMAHDGQCAAAGITTVFDSLALHGIRNELNRREAFPAMVAALEEADTQGLLRVDHLLHLRCEVTYAELLEGIAPQQENPRVQMFSLMDHRPGQRQMANKTAWADERSADPGFDETLCVRNRSAIAELAANRKVTLAAHDDATTEHVDEALALGCSMAEFPVSHEAAQAAREAGMTIAMGAPNFVRGGSHSGNLSARAAAEADLLDILASDYIPLSMLRSAFMLAEAPFNWSLPRAIATVAANPARATGLTDRGELAVGQRADMVRVAWQPGSWPRAKEVYVKGQRVA
jgi:alpha-D-ribose 1-methylphosphonate 5-triphosphate diphosphatase